MKNLPENEAKSIHRRRYRSYRGPQLKGVRSELSYADERFPSALREIPDPPQQLYVIGDTGVLCEGLAIIGARKATPYGVSCSQIFAERAARRGVVIISGGALGCDSHAHKAAINAGGRTVVFLGGGCDELYPASNRSLFQAVIDGGGAIVSEYAWSYPPLKHTFRARNRLIAGLARATLIVEAGLPSGTFSTADEALAAGKEVLVVPGAITSHFSRGANRLLYQGATPVVDLDSFDDMVFSLFGVLKQETVQGTQPLDVCDFKDSRLYEALSAQQMRIDDMVQVMSTVGGTTDVLESVMVELGELQQKGLVLRYPDGRFGVAVKESHIS